MARQRVKKLSKIKYKKFRFPYNPATSTYKIGRSYVEHKYPELMGNELEDFGPNACVITGEGEFFGNKAYSNWRKLLKEFKKSGVGNVSHPVFTDITRGLMTSLQASLEPRPNYVRYTFEIVADTKPKIKECLGKYITVVSGTGVDTGVNSSGASGESSTRNEFVHTVVSGECLSVICARYAAKYGTTISWQTIASYNNLKNPNLIYPGDQIKIYYPT